MGRAVAMISSGVSRTVILALSPENATIVCFGSSNQGIIRTNSRLTTVAWPSGLVHVDHRGICGAPSVIRATYAN
jgi:hypothetical protein